MFNRTIVQPQQTRLVPYEKTVTEHRAPTDESMRLVQEMEEKVTRSILDRGQSTDNELNYKWMAVHDVMGDSVKVRGRLSINGKPIDILVEVPFRTEHDRIGELIKTQILKTLSVALTISIVEDQRDVISAAVLRKVRL